MQKKGEGSKTSANSEVSSSLPESKEVKIRFWDSEILERKISKFGTGAHVVVPKEYAGKKVKIIFIEDKNEQGGKNNE